ncbi:hypothetical protein SAMN05421783_1539 [Thiocapsa roseopersicina]|uniref:Uncharacterized protein n=1 Tax=Thiocapsa roseopersicina TaxID=1058 RepID=A0A1H3DMM9_THIRO|nr:hypothetical protein SAMN05421783_1539 [Thiocapsa roseopersicina]
MRGDQCPWKTAKPTGRPLRQANISLHRVSHVCRCVTSLGLAARTQPGSLRSRKRLGDRSRSRSVGGLGPTGFADRGDIARKPWAAPGSRLWVLCQLHVPLDVRTRCRTVGFCGSLEVCHGCNFGQRSARKPVSADRRDRILASAVADFGEAEQCSAGFRGRLGGDPRDSVSAICPWYARIDQGRDEDAR